MDGRAARWVDFFLSRPVFPHPQSDSRANFLSDGEETIIGFGLSAVSPAASWCSSGATSLSVGTRACFKEKALAFSSSLSLMAGLQLLQQIQ